MPDHGKQRTEEVHVDTTTAAVEDSGQHGHLRVPGLVILAHPDPTRVGEIAALTALASGRTVELSRLEPSFVQPSASNARPRPLADTHLSRQPVYLRAERTGSMKIDTGGTRTPVQVGHQRVEGEHALGREEIERGVTIVLSRRIALLLCLVDPLPAPVAHFGLVGDSAPTIALRYEIEMAAQLDAPVLLRGETGTGKELVARAIHETSGRRGRPYLTVNMGALVPSLAAAELFGAVRGAYTGADRRKTGFFESADGGTLFLDEIGEAPAEVQVLLLRALENHEIHPVGSVEKRRVDVRVIAATDADLSEAIDQGRFRAALLHRLAGYTIRVPTLRERRDDVARLLAHFLHEELGEDTLVPGERGPWPSAEVVARLVAFDWPGNVRQLRNVAVRLAAIRRTGRSRALESLVDELLSVSGLAPDTRPSPAPAPRKSPEKSANAGYRRGSEVDPEELAEALAAHGWQLRPAAETLGISRQTLYRLIDDDPRFRKAAELEAEEITAMLTELAGDVDAAAAQLRVSPQGLKRRMTALGIDP